MYIEEKCPSLKNGTGAAQELDRFYDAYAGRPIEELPEVTAEYTKKEMDRLSATTIRNRIAYLRAACSYYLKVKEPGAPSAEPGYADREQ